MAAASELEGIHSVLKTTVPGLKPWKCASAEMTHITLQAECTAGDRAQPVSIHQRMGEFMGRWLQTLYILILILWQNENSCCQMTEECFPVEEAFLTLGKAECRFIHSSFLNSKKSGEKKSQVLFMNTLGVLFTLSLKWAAGQTQPCLPAAADSRPFNHSVWMGITCLMLEISLW